MINRKISVHLQDYPSVEFFDDEFELISQIDLIQEICSVALAIRDNKNLRVRLPLRSLTIIGKNALKLQPFYEIIADEINVKQVFFQEDIGDLASLKLQLNFKKIGVKYGAKVKEFTDAIKQNLWQKIGEEDIKIKIANEILEKDEFELKLAVNQYDQEQEIIMPLPSNDCLVKLNIVMDKELENEGLARDIIRSIQQNRKDADFEITKRINIIIFSENLIIDEILTQFAEYIKDQVLADSINFTKDSDQFALQLKNSSHHHYFENKVEDINIKIAIF